MNCIKHQYPLTLKAQWQEGKKNHDHCQYVNGLSALIPTWIRPENDKDTIFWFLASKRSHHSNPQTTRRFISPNFKSFTLSVLKSGLVRFLALQGLRLRPRPVHDFQKRKKLDQDCKRLKTAVFCGFKTGLLKNILSR